MMHRYYMAGDIASIAYWIEHEDIRVAAEDIDFCGGAVIETSLEAAKSHEAYEEITESQAKRIMTYEHSGY
jgi:hypothetical protein